MATVKGVLGQSAPAATTEDDLYTVPPSKNATVKVIATNRDASPTTFRVSVGVNGAVTANDQYIAYDVALGANESLSTTSFMIGDADVVRVYAGASGVSFTCTGIEQDD